MVLFERKKKACIAGLGRDQLEHLASPMTKSETSPSPNTTSPRQVRDDRKMSRVRLESETDSSTTALLIASSR